MIFVLCKRPLWAAKQIFRNITSLLVAPIICFSLLALMPDVSIAGPSETGPTKCSDGRDNDRDGLIDGDDPDCQGGGEPPPALEVREAFADQESLTLVLVGGEFNAPVVTFGDNQIVLTNVSVTSAVLTATLPIDLIPGDYFVYIEDGGSSTSLMLTIGATGPQGDPGPIGPEGPPGPSQLPVFGVYPSTSGDHTPEAYRLISGPFTCDSSTRGRIVVARPSVESTKDSICYCGLINSVYDWFCFNP